MGQPPHLNSGPRRTAWKDFWGSKIRKVSTASQNANSDKNLPDKVDKLDNAALLKHRSDSGSRISSTSQTGPPSNTPKRPSLNNSERTSQTGSLPKSAPCLSSPPKSIESSKITKGPTSPNTSPIARHMKPFSRLDNASSSSKGTISFNTTSDSTINFKSILSAATGKSSLPSREGHRRQSYPTDIDFMDISNSSSLDYTGPGQNTIGQLSKSNWKNTANKKERRNTIVHGTITDPGVPAVNIRRISTSGVTYFKSHSTTESPTTIALAALISKPVTNEQSSGPKASPVVHTSSVDLFAISPSNNNNSLHQNVNIGCKATDNHPTTASTLHKQSQSLNSAENSDLLPSSFSATDEHPNSVAVPNKTLINSYNEGSRLKKTTTESKKDDVPADLAKFIDSISTFHRPGTKTSKMYGKQVKFDVRENNLDENTINNKNLEKPSDRVHKSSAVESSVLPDTPASIDSALTPTVTQPHTEPQTISKLFHQPVSMFSRKPSNSNVITETNCSTSFNNEKGQGEEGNEDASEASIELLSGGSLQDSFVNDPELVPAKLAPGVERPQINQEQISKSDAQRTAENQVIQPQQQIAQASSPSTTITPKDPSQTPEWLRDQVPDDPNINEVEVIPYDEMSLTHKNTTIQAQYGTGISQYTSDIHANARASKSPQSLSVQSALSDVYISRNGVLRPTVHTTVLRPTLAQDCDTLGATVSRPLNYSAVRPIPGQYNSLPVQSDDSIPQHQTQSITTQTPSIVQQHSQDPQAQTTDQSPSPPSPPSPPTSLHGQSQSQDQDQDQAPEPVLETTLDVHQHQHPSPVPSSNRAAKRRRHYRHKNDGPLGKKKPRGEKVLLRRGGQISMAFPHGAPQQLIDLWAKEIPSAAVINAVPVRVNPLGRDDLKNSVPQKLCPEHDLGILLHSKDSTFWGI